MKLIEWKINEDDEQRGIKALSLVGLPAIESDWQTFSKEKSLLAFATQDKERQIVMGAALIPRKQILRVNGEGEEYYGFFSEDTVRRGMELFMMDGNISNSTFEHEEIVHGCVLVESWIVEDTKQDKSALYNFNVPKGTWMVSLKINNKVLWEEFVKTGIVKGFSIEGYFTDGGKISNGKTLSIKETNSMKKNLFQKVLLKIEEAFSDVKLAETTLEDGRVISAESFDVGSAVTVELDGEQVPLEDGAWVLESGETIVVASGVIEEVKAVDEEEMTEDEVYNELNAIITSEVHKVASVLQEEIQALQAQVETLKAQGETDKAELSKLKTQLSKKPAKELPRKTEAPQSQAQAKAPMGLEKTMEIFNKYKSN